MKTTDKGAGQEPSIGMRIGKFRLDAAIGEGGQAHVYLATDIELNRLVALKILRSELADHPAVVERFLAEAQRTSSLSHTGIPSVYEFGTSPRGLIYFAMELVHGPTLWDVLDGLRRGDGKIEEGWPLTRLVRMISGVARALHYAHTRGLIHRDVKPSNVSLGRGGDTLVLDWGLAKRFREDSVEPPTGHESQLDVTRAGALMGTPLYMSPEQAAGGTEPVDPRTDVFALGALLYEALCLHSPYDATSIGEVIQLARSGGIEPPSQRNAEREIPPQLAEIAMHALSTRPGDRQATAEQFAADLDDYLLRIEERAVQDEMTSSLLRRAVGLAASYRRIRDELTVAEEEAAHLRNVIPDWAPVARKKVLWSAEARVDVLQLDAAESLSSAVEVVTRCLLESPRDTRAQRLSETLYAAHLAWARSLGDTALAASAQRRLEQLNETTPVDTRRTTGAVAVRGLARGSSVLVTRWQPQDRRLVEHRVQQCEPGDLDPLPLAGGSYVLTVSTPGHVTVRAPFALERGQTVEMSVPLLAGGAFPDDFVCVPAGPFLRGRRPRLELTNVEAFLIQRRPVLIGEYIDWLDALLAVDPEAAERHAPRTADRGAMLAVANGRYVAAATVSAALAQGGARAARPPEEWPIIGVSRSDADAYAAWLGEQTGHRLRLPTEYEWEKAARGVDGREYPWGHHFDVTFCAMAFSTAGAAKLRGVLAFEADESPYGVCDMAGGVSEWCSDAVGSGGTLAVARGGSWLSDRDACSVLTRRLQPPTTRACDLGFRLVAEL